MWFLDSSWTMHDGMGWWMLWGGLMMVVFWGSMIALIVWGATRLTGERPRDAESAVDIARRRYASGEIGRDEFEQIRRDLTQGEVQQEVTHGS